MIFFKLNFPNCFLQYSDPKSTIKNIGHRAHLGDIIGSSYPLNSCNSTPIKGMFIPSVQATFYRNGKLSFKVIIEIK